MISKTRSIRSTASKDIGVVDLPGLRKITDLDNTLTGSMNLVYVQKGNGQVHLNDNILELTSKQYFLSFSDSFHHHVVSSTTWGSDFQVFSLSFEKSEVERAMRYLTDCSIPAGYCHASSTMIANAEIQNCVTRILNLASSAFDVAYLLPIFKAELAYHLIDEVSSLIVDEGTMVNCSDSRVQRVILWMKSNYKNKCRIEKAAEIVGISRSHLNQQFRLVTGLTPVDYRTSLRMQEAQRLMLIEGLTPTQASSAVGYQDMPPFTRAYKRFFGLPPSRDLIRLRTGDLADDWGRRKNDSV